MIHSLYPAHGIYGLQMRTWGIGGYALTVFERIRFCQFVWPIRPHNDSWTGN